MQVRDETLPDLLKKLDVEMTAATTEAETKHKGWRPFANKASWIAEPSVTVFQHTKDSLIKLSNDINAALMGWSP